MEEYLLIKNGRVLPMGGNEPIECGQVLVRGGSIAALGTAVDAPDDCRTVDVKGGWVLPGLIDAHCHIGIFETAIGFAGNDGNEYSNPVTPELRAIDGIYPLDAEFPLAVRSGVTTVATGPGSANPIGGQFAAMKTWGRTMESMVLRAPQSMKMAFGENPKNVFGAKDKQPVTRMATAALIRQWLYKAQEYAAKKDAANGSAKDMPAYDIKLEALEDVVRKKLPVKAHAHRADDIMTALRIAEEFGLDISLEHCTEGHLIADELAAAGRPAILGPFAGFPHKPEMAKQSLESAAILHEAGVKIAIMTDLPANHLWFLPMVAGMCVAAGLPEAEGFRAITQTPAEILGFGGRIGRLAEGMDADIAVFSENPLRRIDAKCVLTVIDGVIRHSAEGMLETG